MIPKTLALLIFVLLGAPCGVWAAGSVGDPQLMSDHPYWQGELSCSTFDRLFKSQAELYTRVTGRKTDQEEDKALASWYWRNTHYFHCTSLPLPDVLKKGGPEFEREYWNSLFSFGHGMCQENHAQYTAEMEYLLGHARARSMMVQGHTSFEAFITGGAYSTGKWVLLDSDITTVCFDKEQKMLMNIEELAASDRAAYLTNRPAKDNRGWLPELYPGDGEGYRKTLAYAPLSGYAGAPPMVHLRPGETLRRFPRPGLGQGEQGTLVFWGICVDGLDGPNRHITYLTDPDRSFNATARPQLERDPNRRARFGNAVFTYKPSFQDGSYKAAVAAEDDQSVTFQHQSPFVIGVKPSTKNCTDPGATLGLVLQGRAACQVRVSTDGMKTFSEPVDFKDGLDLSDLVKGHYRYWLQFMTAPKKLADQGIVITTRCMASGYVMPHLKSDGTQITFNSSGLAVETVGPQAEALSRHIVEGSLGGPSFTVKLKTPRGEKIQTVCWATRSPTGCPPKPELAFKAEYSKDGKNWSLLKEDWRINPPEPYNPPDTWSQTFFFGTKDISGDQLNEVLIRISNNMGKYYQMGQFSAIYAAPNTARTKVTYCWTEGGQEKTESHVYPAGAQMDRSWKIATGKEPALKWIETEPVE